MQNQEWYKNAFRIKVRTRGAETLVAQIARIFFTIYIVPNSLKKIISYYMRYREIFYRCVTRNLRSVSTFSFSINF